MCIHPHDINFQEMPEAHRESAVALSRYRGRNANDWAVVLVRALYGASAAAYAGKTHLRM